jgi:predicted phosphoribosyltransferase/dienelactone hydrolase
VPVAEVIAHVLDAPLDVLLIERLASPKPPHHFVGAVDEHGRISMIKSSARWHHLTSRQMVGPAREAFRELQRRRGRIRAILPELDVHNRTVIVVSQGVASGAKMLGAIASVRDRGARRVVAAAPAGAGEAAWQLQAAADAVVIPHRPTRFTDVAHLYRSYAPVSDDLVTAIVESWVAARPPQQAGIITLVMKVTNDAGQLLSCEVDLPPGTKRGSGPFPAVLFAHNAGSDGRSPRTVPISRRLAKRGVIGVRADLTGHGRSEGDRAAATAPRMLADLRTILQSVRNLHEVDPTHLGLVGAGTGAMLVLQLAHDTPGIRAVVVRGPMCGQEMIAAGAVAAPTMLVCAEREGRCGESPSAGALPSTHEVVEIADATHQFDDAISRELMVNATVDWLVDHLTGIPGEDEESAPEIAVEADAKKQPS